MDVALLIAVDPSPLDPGDPDRHLERLERVVGSLERSQTPVALHVAAHLLDLLPDRRPELLERLGTLDIDWVRTGWGRPDLTVVPDRVVTLAMEREAETLDRLGLDPGPMWIRDGWDHRLPLLLTDAGVTVLLVDASLVPQRRAGVAVYLDRVLPVLPVVATPLLPIVADDRRPAVWTVEPERLDDVIAGPDAAASFRPTTPTEHVTRHVVSGRLEIGGARSGGNDPARDLVMRKLVRLATRLPERLPPGAATELLRACHAPALSAGSSHADRVAVHTALIAARRHIDSARHRGDEWSRLSRIDWDGDGLGDVQVEQSRISLVLDPAAGGQVLALDDKDTDWPVTIVEGEPPGVVCQLRIQPESVLRPELELERVEEGRGEATLHLVGHLADGTVSCRLTVSGSQLRFGYRLEGMPAGRFGPELPFELNSPRARVDGSEWRDVLAPEATAGHRFRLAGGERQVLISSMVPAEMFLRPAAGGVVAWPHWPTPGDGDYEVVVEL